MNNSKNLVGAATRYIAGRNAVQTVYWRSSNSVSKEEAQSKLWKVSRTFNFGKSEAKTAPPNHVRQEQKLTV